MRSRLLLRRCYALVISMMQQRGMMLVGVLHEGQRLELDVEGPCSIEAIVQQLGIPPSTVLVVHAEEVVPHNAIINADIELELIIVSSGG